MSLSIFTYKRMSKPNYYKSFFALLLINNNIHWSANINYNHKNIYI